MNPAKARKNQKPFPFFPENANSSKNSKQSRRSLLAKEKKSNAGKLNAHGIGRAKKSREKKFPRARAGRMKTDARDQPA